jgi:hypothetical protein
MYGAFSPYPKQYGGGPRPVEFIYAALSASRGKAYDSSDWASTVSIENRAFARSIWACWQTNAKMANQFDPTRTTDMLPRWERIYGIFPLPTDTPVERRARLAFKWGANTKKPYYQQIVDDLTTKMGSFFIGLAHTTSSQGEAIYPGFNGQVTGTTVWNGGSGYGSAPSVLFSSPGSLGGVTATGTANLSGTSVASITITNPGSGYNYPPTITFGSGAAAAYATINANPYDVQGTTTPGVSWVDWASAVGHIAVQVQGPTATNRQLWQTYVSAGMSYLDGALPAWVTYSWFQNNGFTLDGQNFGYSRLTS